MITKAEAIADLCKIPSIGKSIAMDLFNIGINSVEELKGKNADDLYNKSNQYAGSRQDRCLLYVFRCAINYAETHEEDRHGEKMKWWNWKDGQ